MIDFDVLRYFGTSNEQLRTFFTAKEGPDAIKAQKFSKWLAQLIQQGRSHSLRYYRFYASADLMWDGPPILQSNVPLTAYAQGKIDLVACERDLNTLGCKDKFIETVPPKDKGGEPTKRVNIQKLEEVCVSIGRSYISRRVDAQCNKYNNLTPSFKYDPRDRSLVGRCRGEAMSEYADIMAEGYGYKHLQRQAIRGMLVYSRNLMFPACSWDSDVQIVRMPDDYEGDDTIQPEVPPEEGTKKLKLKSKIVREGVPMAVVHPSKILYDTSSPLASLNTDTGCSWVGYWDVKRFGDIERNPAYFNKDRIPWSSTAGSVLANNRGYFDLLYAGQSINLPTPAPEVPPPEAGTPGQPVAGPVKVDVAAQNDRTANIGSFYTSADSEKGIFETVLRVKIVPRDWGMGNYPHPVWLNTHVASDDTVIFAEWMPSLPAIYWGHNEDDAKMVNLGQMHEMMPWQDQLSNIMSNLLMVMKRTLVQVFLLNTDVLDKETCDAVIASLKGDGIYQSPKAIPFSMAKLMKLSLANGSKNSLDASAVFSIVAPEQRDAEYINNAFKAVVQILALVERLMMLSPQEQAQAAPREVSATEVAAIESTTQVKFNAISESIDEARAAWKRIIFESGQAMGSDEVELAVTQTFSEATITKAGFKVKDDGDEAGAVAKEGRTIIGSKSALVHNYAFSSRDGGNRITDAQSANTLVTLLNSVLPVIGPEAIGRKRIFEIFNEIFRRLGVYDLRLELGEGESNDVGDALTAPPAEGASQAPDVMGRIDQIESVLKNVSDATGTNSTTIQEVVDLLREMVARAGGAAPLQPGEVAPGVPGTPLPPV